jgi:tetratricopeptide (TPR) repeat protein
VDLLRRIQSDDSALNIAPKQVSVDTHRASGPGSGSESDHRFISQLPTDIADFVGRYPECDHLQHLLTSPGQRTGVPIAVLSGVPGAGKTCLAVHAARRALNEFPDGHLYLELAASTQRPRDVGEVLNHALHALGVPSEQIPENATERAALYRSMLTGKRVVVVIDDALHAGQVRLLLPGSATCAVIATSRQQLAGLPGASLVLLGNLSHHEAIELLGRIIGTSRAMAEPSAADELVASCACLPLAIRIVGAKLSARPAWSLSVLTPRLRGEGRLDELEIGDMSVRAAVAMSYRALSPRLQRAFRLLSLAGPNDFAEWFVTALIGESDASNVVDELVHSSLLTPLGTDQVGQARYRLHDLIRDFAAKRADDGSAQERDEAIGRVLTALHEFAQLASGQLPSIAFFPVPARRPDVRAPHGIADSLAKDSLAWFASERKIMLTIAELACGAGQYALVGQLAEHLAVLHYFEGDFDDVEELWNSVIGAASRAAERKAVAHAQLRLASVLAIRLRDNEAAELLDQSLPVFERNCDIRSLVQAIYWRGHLASRRDDVDTARNDAQRGLMLVRVIGDKQIESLHLRMLAQVLALQGDKTESLRLCERALAIARDDGGLADQRQILYELGEIKIATGDPGWTVEQCRRALGQGYPMGYKLAEAHLRSLLGQAYHALGKYGEAVSELASSAAIFVRHKAPGEYAVTLYHLASAQIAVRDYDAAKENLISCLEVLDEVRMPRYQDLALAALRAC